METESEWASCVLGFIVGALFMFAVHVSPVSISYKASRAIAACEHELPRNQKCELSAVPLQEQKQ